MLAKIGAAILALLIFHSVPARPRLPHDYRAWSRVAGCESGGWTVLGAAYPDSLGINRTNYERYGGTPMPPGPVPVPQRVREIRVADRLVADYGVSIPDQDGCGAW